MDNSNDIDKLLKDSFEHFAPDAPDVWQGISQGVQASQGVTSGAASVATAVKTSAVIIKAVSAVVAVAGLVTGYVLYNNSDEQTKQSAVTVAPAVVEEIIPQSQSTQSESVASTKKQIEPKARADQRLVKHNQKVAGESGLKQSQQPASADTNTNDLNNTVQAESSVLRNQETPVVVPPQAVAASPESNAGNQIKETTEESKPQPAKLPYNPNEGEEGFSKSNIPNVFTPNNDGVNDRFVIEIQNEQLFLLMVTDAGGRLVFESSDKANTWDGKDIRTGVMCPMGDYQWTLQYQFKGSEKQKIMKGLIKLIN